mmetsp:Transcript_2029/g.2875  ORF Transcript_2029/g.2875 Transcript_2029/m.2875 type:complete len:123 (-) Transcript_2029:598-966(-)
MIQSVMQNGGCVDLLMLYANSFRKIIDDYFAICKIALAFIKITCRKRIILDFCWGLDIIKNLVIIRFASFLPSLPSGLLIFIQVNCIFYLSKPVSRFSTSGLNFTKKTALSRLGGKLEFEDP